ncbi:YkuS family protein [Fusibacter tunisiensis]|uniref:Uncharacterized protein n=1 Tax=Fusibacter tunisiensis TaxID=1008308 RepID=A0ABS2MNR9_9FIRM|nr:YkuS family protein [Fusibacter tunisiensis]MBM7561034.1 hypothetical protein [Fusibacter tunisiensis]
MKIAIQRGLENIETLLTEKGYQTVRYGDGGKGIGITVINDVDEAYEEIDPVTFYGTGEKAMILLNASKLSDEEILKYVKKYSENPKVVAVQKGMSRTQEKLEALGYDVVTVDDAIRKVRVSIIRSGDGAYEEIEPVSFYGSGDREVVVLDATQLSQEQLMKYVEKYTVL